MSTSKPKGLGRGLSALMANIEPNVAKSEDSAPASPMSEVYIPIEKIQPNPDQPRRSFTPADLDDLANSIRAKGVIQP
ncbi:MAG: ParB N-terminal domain-containing protein, partial [Paracoccaceae bacterium]